MEVVFLPVIRQENRWRGMMESLSASGHPSRSRADQQARFLGELLGFSKSISILWRMNPQRTTPPIGMATEITSDLTARDTWE
jgi:hypothetical protein